MSHEWSDETRREAAQWYARLSSEEVTPEDRSRHRSWLAASESHREAYASICDTYEVARQAHTATTKRPATAQTRPWTIPSWATPTFATALTLAAAVAVGWYTFGPDHSGTPYQTTAGEHRTLQLADGSTLHLSAATSLVVHLKQHSREIDLNTGEALFEVAKDPLRPFRVHAGDRTIQALGTAFDVDRRDSTVDVAVSEGAVALSAAGVSAPDLSTRPTDIAVKLVRGEAVSYSKGDKLGSPRTVTADQVGSWERGMLYYENTPFARVVDDLNRQFGQHNRVDDPRLANLSITIALKLRDADTTLTTLQKLLPIRIRKVGADAAVFEPAN